MATFLSEPPGAQSQPAKPSVARPRLTIRPARRQDMSAIARFVRSSAEWYRPFLDEKDLSEHYVDEEWADRNYQRRDFYLASLDQEPIGTVSLQYFGQYAYLGYVYLDVKHVSKGYGQSLLRHAERVARLRGMKGLSLIAHPEAVWAKRAYLKYGFRIVATSKQAVFDWQGGVLRPYYEEGFQLYVLAFGAGGCP